MPNPVLRSSKSIWTGRCRRYTHLDAPRVAEADVQSIPLSERMGIHVALPRCYNLRDRPVTGRSRNEKVNHEIEGEALERAVMHLSSTVQPVAAAGILAVCIYLLKLLFFRRGARGNVPDLEMVMREVDKLSPRDKTVISRLRTRLRPRISEKQFCVLCIATALAIEKPCRRLGRKIFLSEFLDSINFVGFIILIEELYALEIPDEVAERLITFEKVFRYVDSKAVRA
jgi:hypothetical protein